MPPFTAESIDELYRKSHQKLIRIAKLQVPWGHSMTPEDLVQEAFVHAMKFKGEWPTENAFLAWMKVCMTRRQQDRTRNALASRKTFVPPAIVFLNQLTNDSFDLEEPIALTEAAITSFSDQESLTRQQEEASLYLDRLCDIDQAIAKTMSAFYSKGQNTTEISDELGISLNTIHTYLSLGRKIIREKII